MLCSQYPTKDRLSYFLILLIFSLKTPCYGFFERLVGKSPLLERMRAAIRVRQYSKHTERIYLDWVRRLIFFHGKRHPAQLGKKEIEAFLSLLAVKRNVSPSTQNQALQAILFLYRSVLEAGLVCA